MAEASTGIHKGEGVSALQVVMTGFMWAAIDKAHTKFPADCMALALRSSMRYRSGSKPRFIRMAKSFIRDASLENP